MILHQATREDLKTEVSFIQQLLELRKGDMWLDYSMYIFFVLLFVCIVKFWQSTGFLLSKSIIVFKTMDLLPRAKVTLVVFAIILTPLVSWSQRF